MISANERMERTYRNTNQHVRIINALREEFCEQYPIAAEIRMPTWERE